MMLVAVVLTAAATALAGPISFIALVAPHCPPHQWHRSLGADPGGAVRGTFTAGGRSLRPNFMPYQLPVGVVTVSLGGIYLIVLLIQESRKK
ncbi:hypothetical protein EH63_27820 [Escherichia coli]|nr:hypothetical protein EH63_27820 [Escherichia coli]